MNEKEILKKIWQKEQALKENNLKMPEPEELWNELLKILDTLPKDSIYYLRYQKLKRGKIWYTGNGLKEGGYPVGNPWKEMFAPFMAIFEQYQAEKTLKSRLELEHIFIEIRINGEEDDRHILVGEKNGDANKAHIVIDGKTAEIRVEDKEHQAPEDLLAKIETILTLKDGKKIRNIREVIEEL